MLQLLKTLKLEILKRLVFQDSFSRKTESCSTLCRNFSRL